jgi:AcrR family transcriptional regulator
MVKRRTLTPELILETAAALANERGDARPLSLTELASALNIRVPSLYNHVAGLEGLQRDLTQWGLQKLLTAVREAVAGKVGREALQAIAHAYRAFAHAQPGVYPLVLKAPPPADIDLNRLSQELVSILQLVLASYGLTGEAALHAIRGWRSVVHGFVSLETSGGFGLPLECDQSFELLLTLYLDGLSQFPERLELSEGS